MLKTQSRPQADSADEMFPFLGTSMMLQPGSERFGDILDALPAAIYMTDAQGRLTYFNRACIAFSGRTPTLGSDQWCVTWKLYYPDGRPMPHDECPMAIALKEERAIESAEAIAERPNGERIWFTPYPTVFRDADGNITGAINMLLDITERKRADESRARLAAIVDSSEDAIISKSLDSIITSWNTSAERLFGYSAEEAIGRPITIIFPPDRLDEEQLIIDRLKRGERVEHFETKRVRKDGTVLDISLTVSPVRDPSGRIIGASKIARDITKQKQAEREFELMREAAENANRAKDKFLAVLSHELRTPLTPVLMTVVAMDMNPDLAPVLRDDIAMIRRNVELEAKLIDDLLDLSRVTSGKLRLSMEPVDLTSAVRHACETCRPFILEKGIQLHRDLPDDTPFVKADPARLQQVLWNLIRNAAKFTPDRGDIYVTVSTTDENRVLIEVRDTGIGIAPHVLPRIFDAFQQGDANITKQFGGMGLGLAISKALVEMHHGTIRARSEGTDSGSTFTVELPQLAREQIAPTPVESATNNGGVDKVRVLVVEDHADTAAVLAKLLRASGYTVKTAHTAAAALDLAGKEAFDVLVSDLGLPDATGYELMKSMMARHSIKGIAMSGYGMEEDLRKSREAGFEDHIVKPANVAQLERSIRRVTSARSD